ncbi:hypothetical protein [Brevibacillus sp. NRS-1366]|uniref:hypothetical protein n=1 Tax=Brevibacillus sp. NRS-1366 TaxID=3233899 RepID=UPI003D22F3C8
MISKFLTELRFSTAIISGLLILVKIRLVTFITANDIERAIYSKERRVLYSIVHFIFNMIIISMFMIMMGDVFSDHPSWYRSWIAIFASIVVVLGYLFVFWMADKGITLKNVPQGKQRIWTALSLLLYAISCMFLPSYFVGTQLFDNVTNKSIEYDIVMFVFLFLISGLVVVLFKPLSKVFEFIVKKVVYIEVESAEGIKKWYLLHPLNKDEFLIGDHHQSFNCKKVKVIKKEELLNYDFNLHSTENL